MYRLFPNEIKHEELNKSLFIYFWHLVFMWYRERKYIGSVMNMRNCTMKIHMPLEIMKGCISNLLQNYSMWKTVPNCLLPSFH